MHASTQIVSPTFGKWEGIARDELQSIADVSTDCAGDTSVRISSVEMSDVPLQRMECAGCGTGIPGGPVLVSMSCGHLFCPCATAVGTAGTFRCKICDSVVNELEPVPDMVFEGPEFASGVSPLDPFLLCVRDASPGRAFVLQI